MGRAADALDEEKSEMDMTPMIDVTFLMIIFFMVVSEISQSDLADVQLPEASMAKPDDKPPPDRFILNIVTDKFYDPATPLTKAVPGCYRVKSQVFDVRKQEDIDNFKRLMIQKAESNWNSTKECSDTIMLIRCDKRVQYKMVQFVQMLCSTQQRIKIFKIQLAIKKER